MAGVVLVADNPTDHHIFLSAFTGVRDLQPTSSGITASTPRGEIKVMDPAAFRSHFGIEPPDVSAGARLAALRFAGARSAALEAALQPADDRFFRPHGSIVVAPAHAMGATLVFEYAIAMSAPAASDRSAHCAERSSAAATIRFSPIRTRPSSTSRTAS